MSQTETQNGSSNKPKEFRIYRPNKTGTGAATKFQLSYKPENRFDPWMVFLTIAGQTGTDQNDNAAFDWKDGAITVKLGDNDLGQILAVFKGQLNEAKLFHESPSGGNKILNLRYDQEKNNYWLQISYQNKDKLQVKYAHGISVGEAALLTVWLSRSVEIIYNL